MVIGRGGMGENAEIGLLILVSERHSQKEQTSAHERAREKKKSVGARTRAGARERAEHLSTFMNI